LFNFKLNIQYRVRTGAVWFGLLEVEVVWQGVYFAFLKFFIQPREVLLCEEGFVVMLGFAWTG